MHILHPSLVPTLQLLNCDDIANNNNKYYCNKYTAWSYKDAVSKVGFGKQVVTSVTLT